MKVWPKSDETRKILKHANGTPFPGEGPAEWPDDTFTHRRVMDGDVTVEDNKKAAPVERGVQIDKVKTEKTPAPDVGKV